jgi:hypothetical protein
LFLLLLLLDEQAGALPAWAGAPALSRPRPTNPLERADPDRFTTPRFILVHALLAICARLAEWPEWRSNYSPAKAVSESRDSSRSSASEVAKKKHTKARRSFDPMRGVEQVV